VKPTCIPTSLHRANINKAPNFQNPTPQPNPQVNFATPLDSTVLSLRRSAKHNTTQHTTPHHDKRNQARSSKASSNQATKHHGTTQVPSPHLPPVPPLLPLLRALRRPIRNLPLHLQPPTLPLRHRSPPRLPSPLNPIPLPLTIVAHHPHRPPQPSPNNGPPQHRLPIHPLRHHRRRCPAPHSPEKRLVSRHCRYGVCGCWTFVRGVVGCA